MGPFDLDQTLSVAFDPRDPVGLPDQSNTKLSDRYDRTTPEVGSGVHVRVVVDARLRPIPAADDSVHYDGTIEIDVHLDFYDADEGETDAVVDHIGILVAVNGRYELPYDLVSNDIVPERASGTLVVHNVLAALP